MKVDYDCLHCSVRSEIDVATSETGWRRVTNPAAACPACGKAVGTGPVRCRKCGATFEVWFPHWHDDCDMAGGVCPDCGTEYVSLCIC